jgi:hypothetical protein
MLLDTPSPWGIVASLQRAASAPRVDDRVRGIEDALDAVVGMIELGQPILANVVKNLGSNRAAKARARRRISATYLAPIADHRSSDRIETRQMLCLARTLLGESEFALLVDAVCDSYVDAARDHGVPVGTVKARVSRSRARLRAAM